MEIELPHKSEPGKGFKHYFFDFLMLFLAVFCGFLAENIRESRIEDERAEVLAKNLYKEILADSIRIQHMIAVRKIKESECTYFISYVKDSSLTKLSNRFYRSFSWAFIQTGRILFEPDDGILNQLKNSGELRYFKSAEFQAAVGDLSVTISNIRARNDREYGMVEMYIRPFTLKYFDFEWLKELTRDGDLEFSAAMLHQVDVPITGKLPNADKFDRKEAENIASYYLLMLRSTRMAQYAKYSVANHHVLKILRKEYHLE